MIRRDIVTRARLVIASELACDPFRVTEAADFRTDLKADSLDVVSLTAALEAEFDVAISDDEADFCQTVGTAIDIIAAKIEQKASGGRRGSAGPSTARIGAWR
jgi:acyl carrier protein